MARSTRARVCVCRIAFIDLPVAQFEAGDQLEGAEGGEESGEEAELPLPASRGTLANNCWYSLMIFD